MIIDNETNFVYFSEMIKELFPNSVFKIVEILKKHGIKYDFLKETNDIWCRDYMPIQISENKFVQFKYEPSYLTGKEKYEKSKSIPKIVCYKNNFEPIFSEINIDGGNVVKNKNKVILTDRIFSENPTFQKQELINQLKEIFETEIIIIPTISGDTFGHADGCIRFCDDNKIIVSELENEFQYFKKSISKIATENEFEFYELPRFEYKNKKYPENAIGIYLNFLEIGELIIFPIFNIEGNKDEQAITKIKEFFPNKIIEPIEINEIGLNGGLMNCISWNIYKPIEIPNPPPLHLIDDVIKSLTLNDWKLLFDLIPEFSKNNFDYIERKFIEIVYKLNLVINFDWMNWKNGKELFESKDFNLEKSDLIELCKLITVFARNDRFCQGFLHSEIRNGKILKVINRMNEIKKYQ